VKNPEICFEKCGQKAADEIQPIGFVISMKPLRGIDE
jgi:hypothetical protein